MLTAKIITIVGLIVAGIGVMMVLALSKRMEGSYERRIAIMNDMISNYETEIERLEKEVRKLEDYILLI